ncbi:hypothetical protein Psfp_02747 [Pelotomaculum sp. FP]|uniref:hypothetical protein n=1 Tax=Pelotomaculum sp. FP TaxID=261474 RepID=UPI001064E031|nr:hypothetical protein [Pelotomaculum sp. FP]TEB14606.1 hypothetical protein Psfp_02747 [Pelotomaculum sp. FP]
MATIKKRTRSRKRRKLTNDQFWNLRLRRSDEQDKVRPAFSSPEERRQAWLEHRDDLMAKWSHEGRRPGAWWTYEHPKLERLPDEEDWEYLIRAGEVSPEEWEKILTNYLFILENRFSWLRMVQKLSPDEFKNACQNFNRQAKLLGEQALKKWEELYSKL